ncbi:hypothetical protein, partial [Photorhabdus laumondii]
GALAAVAVGGLIVATGGLAMAVVAGAAAGMAGGFVGGLVSSVGAALGQYLSLDQISKSTDLASK